MGQSVPPSMQNPVPNAPFIIETCMRVPKRSSSCFCFSQFTSPNPTLPAWLWSLLYNDVDASSQCRSTTFGFVINKPPTDPQTSGLHSSIVSSADGALVVSRLMSEPSDSEIPAMSLFLVADDTEG